MGALDSGPIFDLIVLVPGVLLAVCAAVAWAWWRT